MLVSLILFLFLAFVVYHYKIEIWLTYLKWRRPANTVTVSTIGNFKVFHFTYISQKYCIAVPKAEKINPHLLGYRVQYLVNNTWIDVTHPPGVKYTVRPADWGATEHMAGRVVDPLTNRLVGEFSEDCLPEEILDCSNSV